MIRKIKFILKLKYFDIKRSNTNNLDILNNIIGAAVYLIGILSFLLLAYISDKIFAELTEPGLIEQYIFQITVLLISFLSIYRIIFSQSLDTTALNLNKIGNGKKSTIFYHLLFNVINIISISIFLLFAIVGVKNFWLSGSYSTFFSYIATLVMCIAVFELLVLIYKQYFVKKHTLIFFLILSLIGASIFYSITKLGFVLPIANSLISVSTTLIALLLIFPAYKTTKNMLFVDQTISSQSSYKIDNIRSTKTLFIKYILRNKSTRNYILLGIVLYPVFYLMEINSIMVGFLYSFLYLVLAEITFDPDYKWIGYLHSGMVNIEKYIKNKLDLIQLLFLIILAVHGVFYYFLNVKWLGGSISLIVFYMGILPYLLCFLEIKGFKPREPYNKGTFNNPDNRIVFILIPITFPPLLFYQLIYDSSNILSLPLIIIGLIGLVMHSFWITKIGEYYNKKRFEIFEKSEAK